MSRLWKVYAATSLALIVVHFVLPVSYRSFTYVVVGLSCVGAILAGIALNKPAVSAPWHLIAAGQAIWVAGDVMRTFEQRSEMVSFPALSDILYVASYPATACGVFLLIRAQRRSRDLAGLVDSLIVTAGIGLLSWAFVAGPIFEDPTVSPLGRVVALAYPAADLLILALLVRLMTGQGTWTPSFRLLVGGTLTLLVADTGFATSPTDPEHLAVLEFLWLASYVLWGTAALHPDMATLATPTERGPASFTRLRLLILSGVVVLPVVLFFGYEAFGLEVDPGALLVGAAVLSLLVMGRLACDIEEIRLTTRQRDDLQEDLFRRATQDEVTGLVNRPSFLRVVESALDRGVRDNVQSALVVVEVSGIGSQHGDARDDAVLREIVRRIGDAVEPDNQVGRIGPNQFGILIDDWRSEVDLARVAHDVLAACQAPVNGNGNGQSFSHAASAGVVVSSMGGDDANVLLRNATLAIASARGEGRVEFFDAALRAEVLMREEIEAGLAMALRTGELEIHYQPLLAIGTSRLAGFEALVRWNRPGRGMASPDSFIPIAEKSDLIFDLDRWMLREATRRLAEWTRADPRRCSHLTVAVNVSGRNLAGPTIVNDVADALRRSGLRPEQLTLEITETVLVDIPSAAAQMRALRQLGVRISIDDFGTGYTSIGQLGQLPADTIKVDRSLVTSERNGARDLLALIVQAGHSSGLRVVAEGIEHADQLATVTDLLYDSAQGYLIGRPGPVSDEQPPDFDWELDPQSLRRA